MTLVGLLGGTFDPIHFGHLIGTEAVRNALGLDLIELVPANDPPHKSDERITSTTDRVAMVQAAIQDVDGYAVNLCEIRRQGRSFTVDTLEHLASTRPDDQFLFIIGSDSLRDLPTWKSPERILELARLAVLARPGITYDFARLEERLPGLRQRCCFVDTPMIDISSTRLRAMVKSGKSIRFQTPEQVITYIERSGIYR